MTPSSLTWDASMMPKLAQTGYDNQAFDPLPSLADAVEEAGGTDPDILVHCRHQGARSGLLGIGCYPRKDISEAGRTAGMRCAHRQSERRYSCSV